MSVPSRSHRLLLALVLSLSLTACNGESGEALLSKARQSLDAGDRKAALIHLKSAIQADEGNARHASGWASCSWKPVTSPARKKSQARPPGWLRRRHRQSPSGQSTSGQGEFKRLLEELPQAKDGSSSEVRCWSCVLPLSLAWARKRKHAAVSRAPLPSPKDVDALLARARLDLADGDAVKASQHIDEALRVDPNHRDGWLFKGDLLRMTASPPTPPRPMKQHSRSTQSMKACASHWPASPSRKIVSPMRGAKSILCSSLRATI